MAPKMPVYSEIGKTHLSVFLVWKGGFKILTDNFHLWLPAFPCHSSYLPLHFLFLSLIIYALFLHFCYAVLELLEYLICREQVSFVTQCHPLSHSLLFHRDFIFFLFFFFFSVLPKEREEMIALPLVASFSLPWPHGRLCRMINRMHSKWYNTVITFSIDIIEASAVFKLLHFTTIALYFHSYSIESNVPVVFPG